MIFVAMATARNVRMAVSHRPPTTIGERPRARASTMPRSSAVEKPINPHRRKPSPGVRRCAGGIDWLAITVALRGKHEIIANEDFMHHARPASGVPGIDPKRHPGI